jgi:hypothetical protein
MFHKYTGCAGLAALLLASPAVAHHPSGVGSSGGAGPIATIPATTLEEGRSAAAVFFEMVKIAPFSDAELKTFAGQHIHAHSLDAILAPTLIYAYGVTNDLTVIGRLPVVTRQDIREGHHSHGPAGNTVDERGDSSGIGDLTLLGLYRFYNNKTASRLRPGEPTNTTSSASVSRRSSSRAAGRGTASSGRRSPSASPPGRSTPTCSTSR